ncbi:MAG: hypothetical protein WCN21_01800 [Comamonadaceae bacterium]
MKNDNLQDYFRGQQVSLQWLPILRALAFEMSANAQTKELRQLFFKIGEHVANDAEDRFEAVRTLEQLEERLNDFWSQINWGWVDLTETKGYIEISHQAAPLAEAFGNDALEWSIGLLEGFYQSVFKVLGASETMVVQGIGESSNGMDIRLHFGRPD